MQIFLLDLFCDRATQSTLLEKEKKKKKKKGM